MTHQRYLKNKFTQECFLNGQKNGTNRLITTLKKLSSVVKTKESTNTGRRNTKSNNEWYLQFYITFVYQILLVDVGFPVIGAGFAMPLHISMCSLEPYSLSHMPRRKGWIMTLHRWHGFYWTFSMKIYLLFNGAFFF